MWQARGIAWPHSHPRCKKTVDTTNPRTIINAFACFRRMNTLGEIKHKYESSKATSVFEGGRKGCWSGHLPRTVVGGTPPACSTPGGWSGLSLSSPTSSQQGQQEAQVTFALQFRLRTSSDKVESRNTSTSIYLGRWMDVGCVYKQTGKLESTGRRIDQNYCRTWKRSADPNWEEIHIITIKTLINLKGKYKRDRNLVWKDNRISHAWKKHVTQWTEADSLERFKPWQFYLKIYVK